MEGKKQYSSSSSGSSFTSDLFGSKGSSSSSGSSSSELFISIFAPPSSKVMGRASVQPDGEKVVEKTHPDSAAVYWNSRIGISDDTDLFRVAGTRGVPNANAYYQEQEEKAHPCHYSSSIYYGGQDVYSHSKSTTQSSSYASVRTDYPLNYTILHN